MKKGLTIVLVLFCAILHGQINLVPNQSFEQNTGCPNSPTQIYLTNSWITPTTGTPDYYNSCNPSSTSFGVPANIFGNQNAKTGNAYVGCYYGGPGLSPANNREYIQVQLTDSMISGHKYGISFNVSLSEWSSMAISNIGCYISINAPTRTDNLPINAIPQIENANGNYITDKTNWTTIAGAYIASGDEKFITVGNFHDDSSTDSITIVPGINGRAYYYYIDDVSVIDSTAIGIEQASASAFSFYPNPVMESLTIETRGQNEGHLKISDITGRELISEPIIVEKQSIDVSFLSEGVYFLSFFDENKQSLSIQKLIKE